MCTPIVANFSNDGVTWGADVVYDRQRARRSRGRSRAATARRRCTGRVRDGIGNTVPLSPLTVILDATAPTTPGTVTRTVSCSGFESHHQHRLGRVDRCRRQPARLPGLPQHRRHVTWSALGSTVAPDVLDQHSKRLTTMRSTSSHTTGPATSTAAPTPPSASRRTSAADGRRSAAGVAEGATRPASPSRAHDRHHVLLSIVMVAMFNSIWSMQRSEAYTRGRTRGDRQHADLAEPHHEGPATGDGLQQ